MPTKLGKGGHGPQEYVPEGNGKASGTYADDSGVNIYGSFKTFKKPDGFDNTNSTTQNNNKIKTKTNENNNIGLTPNNSKIKPKYKSFDDYCETVHKGSFGESLKQQYNGGTQEAKELVDKLVNNGIIKIEQTTGIANYWGSVNLNDLSNKKGVFSKDKGEVFYHEFWHAFDEYFASDIVDDNKNKIVEKLITKEDIEKASKGKNIFETFLFVKNLSTGKILSNGKTLLETIKEEGRKLTKEKGWGQMQKDFQKEIDDELEKKYPNAKETQAKYNNIERDLEKRASTMFPMYSNGNFDNNYWEKREAFKKDQPEYSEFIDLKNKINEINREKSKIEHTIANKGWINLSDMYGIYNGVRYGFCGGHAGNYGKKIKGAMAHEFIAEYGSAYSRNNKEEIEIMRRYFPEASKMSEEIIQSVIKASRGI